MKPEEHRDSALFDEADVEDASAFEWRQGAGGVAGLAVAVGRIVRRKRFWLAVILAIGIAGAIYAHSGQFSVAETMGFFRQHPVIAPLLFVFLYALLAILLLPTLPLNLAAGMLWGWFFGAIFTLIGVVIGASLAFFVARYLGRDFVEKRLQGRHWQPLWRTIDANGWKAVAFARINPVFPSGPLNYFFGLTSIAFWPYFFSTLLFLLPPSLFFSAIGDSIGGFALEGAAKDLVNKVLAASGAIVVVVVLRLFLKRAQQKKLLR